MSKAIGRVLGASLVALVFVAAAVFAIGFVRLSPPPVSAADVRQSGPQESRLPDGAFELALRGSDRVCCRRGWQDWWTTWRDCRRFNGRQVANRQCRNNWNDRWDRRWWGWNGGNWNARVCCSHGRRAWWTTARECRNSFGFETSNRQCR